MMDQNQIEEPQNSSKVFLISGSGMDSVVVLSVASENLWNDIITIQIANQDDGINQVECSLPLHRLFEMIGDQTEREEKMTITMSNLLKCFGFRKLSGSGVNVKLQFGGQKCEMVVFENSENQDEKNSQDERDDIPTDAKTLIECFANRKEDLSRQLTLILREQRKSGKEDDHQTTTSLQEELNILLTDPNCKSQWMANMEKCNQNLKSVTRDLLKSLSKVFKIKLGTKMEDVSHPMINYGIKTANGLRFVLFLLCNSKIIPEPSVIKYAVIAETRYGSFRNAEMLTILFLELFNMKVFEWRGSRSDEYSWATAQLLGILSLLVRHAPNANLAVYYFEMVNQILKSNFFISKPSNVHYACVVFSLVISCKSSEDVKDEQVEKMKNLIEHYYNEGMENDGGESTILKSIYESYKTDSTNPVPTPSLEESEMEFDDNASCVTFSSTLTCDISIYPTMHAHRRMFERDITEDDIKRCIKHGVRKLSKEVVKCTDENCIVVYKFVGNTPNIITVYKHTKVRTPEISNSELCDYLITQGFYGDYDNCNVALKELLENKVKLNDEEKEDLAETLLYLFKDCCPTYEGLKLIIQVMMKFNILYDVVNKYIPRSVNPYSDSRGRAKKFYK